MQRFWLVKKDSSAAQGPYDERTLLMAIHDGRIRARDQINKTSDERFWFDAGLLADFPRNTPHYHDWLWCLRFNTANVGPKGTALVAATLPVTLLSVIVGMQYLPPGTYLKIALAAPGILAGLVFLYVFGFLLFKLPNWLALALSGCVTVAGLVGLICLLRSMAG